MKNLMAFAIVSIILIGIPFTGCSQGSEKNKNDKTKNIVYTTLDVKASYEVIKVITGFSEVSAASSKDSFLSAYGNAWANLATEANKLNSDAVVGIKIEIVQITDNLRILAYGTAVKYTK